MKTDFSSSGAILLFIALVWVACGALFALWAWVIQ